MKKTNNKNRKTREKVAELKPVSFKNYYYILGILVFFVFANTISGGYNLDDELVTMNHRFTSQGLTAVKDIFTNSYYADAMGYAYGYRPMVHLSFAIEHQFFSESPKVSHFFNVLLYVLSIVLFFKLLLKWFGVEQLKLAFLAVILFALHPVHTEVVASIKNRDEILAFLFIILTGLSMVKYLDKRKVSSLIWIVALFTMAMLSKKSAYPMAIVLPVAFVLFQNISRKQLSLLSLAVIFPAAIIGSELSVVRMILMIVLPILGIGSIYFIKTQILEKNQTKHIKHFLLKPYVTVLITLLIVAWAIYTNTYSALILTVPFLIWTFKTNFQAGLIVLTIISLGIGTVYGFREFLTFSLLIAVGTLFYLLSLQRKNNSIPIVNWVLSGLLFVAAFALLLLDSRSFTSVLLLVNIGVLFWLLLKKPLWGVIVAVTSAVTIVIIYQEINFYASVILTFSVLILFREKLKLKIWLTYFVVVVFSCLHIWFWPDINQLNKSTTTNTELPVAIQKVIKNPKQNSFLKEGRQLEFAENTLVAPHTTEETIGTGAATLGEYIRLMVFPYELSFYYGFARMDTVSLSNPFVWTSILIHLGLIFLAIWQIKRRPIISFGIMWYLLSIILFSNWVELVAGMVAERLLFVASAGFCIFIAGIVFWIKPQFSSKKPYLVEGVVGLLIIAFVFKTIDRNALWNNPITLMENDMNHLQSSAQANNLYALRLMATSNENPSITEIERKEAQQKALFHFSEAVRIDSTFFNALFDKGRAAQQMGDTTVAIETFKVAIQREPDYIDSYQFLLMEYEKKQDWKNYISTAKKLLSKDKDPNTYDFISKGFFMQNKPDSSLVYIYQGLKNFPNDANLIERKKYLESVVPAQ